MNSILDKKYTGDGGNEQRIFIKDARIGWRHVMNDAKLHLSNGITQYEYLETLGPRLGGQARRLLDNFIDKWDYHDTEQPFYKNARARETQRALWRVYYKNKAIFDLRQVQVAPGGTKPEPPSTMAEPVPEPDELNEFLEIIQETFQAASAVYLEDLNAFAPLARESLIKMADRFDEVALPLLTAGLMTSRGLALNLRRHIPIHIRRNTLAAMLREDERRFEKGKLLIDKDELMALAQRKEAFLLEFEAEMRATGQTPDPRMVEDHQFGFPPPPRPSRPPASQPGREARDRGTIAGDSSPADTRECNICKQVGHIARNCPTPQLATTMGGGRALPPPPRGDNLAGHKTPGGVCGSCNKPGHVEAQCWTLHPELVPEAIQKKRQGAMTAATTKRMRAAEYASKGYQFQGMAYTYNVPDQVAMMVRASKRTHQPSQAAREAAEQPTARRARIDPDPPTKIPTPSTGAPDPIANTQTYTEGVPGFQDGYELDGHLPQSFPHGLPPSSLEPGTSDMQFPPSNLFPESPLGDGEVLRQETLLQTMTQLRSAATNMQQLVSELSERLWDKASDTERHSSTQNEEPATPVIIPAVPAASRGTTIYTPAFIDNSRGVLDVAGYVPKEAILDTGATKVMLSRAFAAAIPINKDHLLRGEKYVTANGAIEVPLGVTRGKLQFTLGRGTPHEQSELLYVTVVETTAYDVLLGMEFMTAFGGAYDTYTEMFKYRWTTTDGKLQSHEISAPCHSATMPLYAYAYFTDLICHETELEDVQSSSDENIPEEVDERLGEAAERLRILATTSQEVEATRVRKELGAINLGRRESAAARLACINPLTLPLLLPSACHADAVVEGVSPIDTTVQQFTRHAMEHGLHVVELFGGIGLGALRAALAAGYNIRCYTYVDQDSVSRRIARTVLNGLQQQYPLQLQPCATASFDKRLPQDISHISHTFLCGLVAHHGPVDLLGGSWECQSVSRAGRQRGANDARFFYFYDLVRIINFFQQEQTTSPIYILENTYPGENCTTAVENAGKLVQAYLGAPVLVDGANLGAAAHRVRLFWTNMLPPAVLQAALPSMLLPSPPLQSILHAYHIPTSPGHSDRFPFALHNEEGGTRVCMPTIVSYLGSNAFRAKVNGDPGEGQVFNLHTDTWEEPDVIEKEMLLGFQPNSTHTPGVSRNQRAIRLGRALDGTTMAWMGAFLQACQK